MGERRPQRGGSCGEPLPLRGTGHGVDLAARESV